MNISSSSFSYGLAAYQAGQSRVDQAGSVIAANTLPNDGQARTDQVRSVEGSAENPADKAAQLVSLEAGKTQALAGARLIQAADETLGTLINTYA
ncbi:hypothetical protein IQ22_01206 [Pseudomonas duriflava]|uniref:Pyrroloquinoline quinone biosynthesis protein PqqE n=1 Tax=Pseudomonas duriflava TaxID=459528 RepID=A0A562QJ37_9PSED|nr:hypothetical protein [Pseudomonas duriflava]TWI56754.1 hypothetical protein IQ22_01206 [Pseudomonas duriflava]